MALRRLLDQALAPRRRFAWYLTGRLAWVAIALWAVVSITFLLIYIIPGDPVSAVLGGRASGNVLKEVQRQYGFDRPVLVQYSRFWSHLFHGDLGFSFATQQPVWPAIRGRLGATAELAVAGVLLELLIGVCAGIFAALNRGTWRDRAAIGIVVVGIAVPPFFMGLLLIYLFAFLVPILPVGGGGGIRHLVLPALTIGLTGGAYYARLLRARLVEVMDEDFVRVSRSRGLRERAIFTRHVLRNSILPVVTWFGMDLGYFLSGVVAVEAVFGWPGIGLLTFNAISTFDTPMIIGTVLVSSVAIVLANLCIDLLYPVLDPRISRT
ncbi:MAG: ABC transporter permease [Gaiellaceae bacterium]